MKRVPSLLVLALLVLAAVRFSDASAAVVAAAPSRLEPSERVYPASVSIGTAAAVTATTDLPLKKVVLGMGFIPNVQFAPFYVADSKGYFADEGLQVEFNYGMEDDLLKLIGTGRLQFAIGSGDQVILARSQELPVVYVANFYRRFPVQVMSLKEGDITEPRQLEGKKVGISCLCGASYVAWKALAFAGGLDEQKVNLQVIGFTQASAVDRGQVDAALDYAGNGPAQLRLEGKEINVIDVSQYINLISNGIIAGEDVIQRDPQVVQALVRAFLRGLRDTLQDPASALEATFKYVPEAGGENRPRTEAVLQASIQLWQGDNLGLTRREDWAASQSFMRKVGLIDQETDVDKMFSNEFVEKASR